MRFWVILTFLCELIMQTAVGQVNVATPYTFITMAGGGTKDTNGHPIRGFQDGQGPNVQFRYPESVVVDKTGNAYVADTANHVIRKITPAGVVSLFCGIVPDATNRYGDPLGGYRDGPASNALFNGPVVGCIDSFGTLYVSDCYNHLIRKVSADGMVSTIAGRIHGYSPEGYPIGGYADGIGTNALFYNPMDLEQDALGNIYVADGNNNCIRLITPNGTVTTMAGSRTGGYADGIGTNALFNGLWGIALDSAGKLFVTEAFNRCIRQITPVVADGETNWVVTTLAGNHTNWAQQHVDGTGTNAYFQSLFGIAIDAADNLYVSEQRDNLNGAIRKVTPTGKVTTLAGGASGYSDGTGNEARFYYNVGMAVDDFGNVYVADNGNNVIRKGWDATAKPIVAFDSPISTTGILQLNFTVMTGTVTNFTLLETSQLGAAWTTNSDAVATTYVSGLSYTYTVPITNTARFYQVRAN